MVFIKLFQIKLNFVGIQFQYSYNYIINYLLTYVLLIYFVDPIVCWMHTGIFVRPHRVAKYCMIFRCQCAQCLGFCAVGVLTWLSTWVTAETIAEKTAYVIKFSSNCLKESTLYTLLNWEFEQIELRLQWLNLCAQQFNNYSIDTLWLAW